MRFSVQRFPIMSASICHTWLWMIVEQQNGRGHMTSLKQSWTNKSLTFGTSSAPLFFFFFPENLPGASRCRRQGRTEGIMFPLVHLQLMVHSYSVEAWPIRAHLNSYTIRYANVSSAEGSPLRHTLAELNSTKQRRPNCTFRTPTHYHLSRSALNANLLKTVHLPTHT